MAWRERVDSLLLDGERIEVRYPIEGHELIVTSHRVLAFVDEEQSGAGNGNEPRFHAVDRPNATGVALESGGRVGHLLRAVPAGLVGLGLLAIPRVIDISAPIPSELSEDGAGDAGGFGVADDGIRIIETLFTVLELGILLAGVVICVVALVYAGLYLRSRQRTLVVRVAGDDDVELPVRADPGSVVTEVEAAIEPGTGTAVNTGSGARD